MKRGLTVEAVSERVVAATGHRDLRWLAVSDQLQEEPTRFAQFAIVVSFVLVLVLVTIAVVVPLPVTATAPVKVVSDYGERALSSASTATVQAVLVDEGSLVVSGQVIAELRDLSLLADIEETMARRGAVARTVSRLRALVAGSIESHLGADVGTFSPNETLDAERRTILREQQTTANQRKAIGEAEIAAQRVLVDGLERSLLALQEQMEVVEQQVKIRRSLQLSGAGSLVSRLEAEQVGRQLARDIAETAGRVGESREALTAARARLIATDSAVRSERGDVLDAQLGELEFLDARLRGLAMRLSEATIRAPVAGVVKSLSAKPGERVREGEPIAVIVTTDSGLRVDADMPARFAALVRPGMAVNVAIDGLDPYRYGHVTGLIRDVSASSFEHPDRAPTFRVRVDIVNGQGPTSQLRPGLTGTADVVIEHRTVWHYLANSVARVWGQALSEP